MTQQGDRKLLEEMYVINRLKKIEIIHESVNILQTDAKKKLIFEQLTTLIEGINTQQFKAYLGWFKQVKTFLKQHELPALRKGLKLAQDEIQDLLRGTEQGEAKGITGFLKKVAGIAGERGQEISRSASSDMKRLNDVNHFLWGITTFISSIPTILAAIDDRLEGKLLGELSEGIINEAEPAATSIQPTQAPPEAATVDPVDESLYNKIINIGGPKGDKFINDFRKLLMGTMKQSVKNFSANGLPFIDPKKVINDILKMKISDIHDLTSSATELSTKWNSVKTQVVDDVKALDQAADKLRASDDIDSSNNGDASQKISDVMGTQNIDQFIDTVENVANTDGKNATINLSQLIQQVAAFDHSVDGDKLDRLSAALRKLKLEGRLKQ